MEKQITNVTESELRMLIEADPRICWYPSSTNSPIDLFIKGSDEDVNKILEIIGRRN